MRLFGFEIRRKAAPTTLASVPDSRGGWWPIVRESYSGAWQRNDEWTPETVLAYHAVYACVTLIASDVGKLRACLVEQDANGIWTETTNPAFSPVLRKPNHYQNHIQFKEWWILSKLTNGNTYALIQRDGRNAVRALYLLDPTRVRPLVAPDGSVYYELSADNLSGVAEKKVVPASEIIHDRMNCIFHPLVGTSPIFACGAAANVGIQIQSSSSHFFGNDATPSGILTAPGVITIQQAEEMSARWKANYSGPNRGKVAVLGAGLEFKQLTMTSVDAQLIEQLKWTAETVCSAFHVPPFKISVGTMPTYSNGEILDQRYYSDCLQSHIEHFELAMDEGLGLLEKKDGKQLGVELDLDGLMRMDTATQIDTLTKAAGGAIMTPDEARARLDKKPLEGGNTLYRQQQDYSLAALAERDQNKPFAKPLPAAPAVPALPPGDPPEEKTFDVDVFLKSVADYEAGLCLTN